MSEPAPLTAEQKKARLDANRAKNAAVAAAKARGASPEETLKEGDAAYAKVLADAGVTLPAETKPAAPASPAAPAPAPAPAAAAPAAAAPLTAEQKKARLDANRAKNAALSAAKARGASPEEAQKEAEAAYQKSLADAGVTLPAETPAAAAPAKSAVAVAAPASAAAAAAAPKPAAPAAAAVAKPKAAAVVLPPPPQLQARRTFLEWGFAAWTVFFIWLGGVGHMFLRFMFPNVLYEQDPKFNAGKKGDYPELNKVYEHFKQSQAVWLVRLSEDGQDRLVALSTVCTHLGCTPNWLEAEQKFKCPCHGSGYYKDGVNFEGPTPRPLERFRIFQDATGNIVVDKSKKYRQDLGQWNENESYFIMA